MEHCGIIPVYVNIPGQGWTPYGITQWVYICYPRTDIVTSEGWNLLPKEPTLSLAGYEYKFRWLEHRVLLLVRDRVPYFALANGVNAIRVNCYPVNVAINDLLELLRKVTWIPKTTES